jgi:hypothetical protein
MRHSLYVNVAGAVLPQRWCSGAMRFVIMWRLNNKLDCSGTERLCKKLWLRAFQQELSMIDSRLRFSAGAVRLLSAGAVRLLVLIAAMSSVASFAAAQGREAPGSVAIEPKSRQELVETAPPEAAPTASSAGGKAKGSERLREGTRLIDVVGAFQSVGGDSVSFSPGGNKDSFRVLENLALERVSRTLDENRGTRQWVVSGIVTEYRGSNYLLVTKAVVQLHEGDAAAGQ